MNRINKLFQEKRDNILSIYFTAGYPSLNDTEDIIKTLDDCGVDLIEIGMPFSDPIADGPVIQDSSNIAIDNGMNLNVLFKQLLNIRKITSIPIVLMGYINPVYQYGYEKFINSIMECDLDGLILPDLPLDDYKNHFKAIFDTFDAEIFEWAVVELDYCDTDMMTALARSYRYLIRENLARGNV